MLMATFFVSCESNCSEDPVFENSSLRQDFGFLQLPPDFKFQKQDGLPVESITESGNRFYTRDTQSIANGTWYFAKSIRYEGCKVVYEEDYFLKRSEQHPDSILSIGFLYQSKEWNPWRIELRREGIPSDFATLFEIYQRWKIPYPALADWIVWLRNANSSKFHELFRRKSLEERTWRHYNNLGLIPDRFKAPKSSEGGQK
jgi:hypothetical protein